MRLAYTRNELQGFLISESSPNFNTEKLHKFSYLGSAQRRDLVLRRTAVLMRVSWTEMAGTAAAVMADTKLLG